MSVEARRSVKTIHLSDSWKRRVRADVLDRVREQRASLLRRARGGASSQNDGLRSLVNVGLHEILHEAIDTETRRRMSQDPDDSDDGMWDDVLDPLSAQRSPKPSNDANHPSTFGSGRRAEPSEKPNPNEKVKVSPSATWNELRALGFTGIEYDELMAEMHLGFEEELRNEEAYLLALELEKTELQEQSETVDACERHDRWLEKERHRKKKNTTVRQDPAADVLCPVCRESRLFQTRGSIFCPRGDVRLSRKDPTSEGNAGRVNGSEHFSLEKVRERLADVYEKHAAKRCPGALRFSMKDAFGEKALYAECGGTHADAIHSSCDFLEVVL